MAAMANETILRTGKDWDDWYEGVQMKAMALYFYKYTDLDAERMILLWNQFRLGRTQRRPNRRWLNRAIYIDSEFSDFRCQELENALENGEEPLSVQKMIDRFRPHCPTRIAEDEPEYSKNNAVFATYQDQSTKETADTTGKESTRRPRGNQRNKFVWRGPHLYVKCWIFNAEERPSGWTPRKEIEDKVKKALKKRANEEIR
ncbi:hypothetical protein AJ78_02777 [Emergomyces pasteurianus Ep9510]|uniref:Uncharacterized protein n=1 Tax=Emergomyces pasteurianus Ep9510 TaxID=1447872 RepID=A0A1J9QMM4_9EURO|nr:hypothetical protein AJ78_02777 [Emergomyces pasteurianus Ep9510]